MNSLNMGILGIFVLLQYVQRIECQILYFYRVSPSIVEFKAVACFGFIRQNIFFWKEWKIIIFGLYVVLIWLLCLETSIVIFFFFYIHKLFCPVYVLENKEWNKGVEIMIMMA